MKILIIGGNGHVGGAIKMNCLSEGYDVTTVSRSGDVKADISNVSFIQNITSSLSSCDVIIHCAAQISKSLTDPLVSMVNCTGTQQIINAAEILGAKRLIYISSIQVIGNPILLPIDESHPLKPNTSYHASKLFGEHIINLASSSGLLTVNLRITSPVGPLTPRGRIFSEFVHKAISGEPLLLSGNGNRRQNYVDVRDIAHAVSLCIKSDVQGVLNVAGSEPVSNFELANKCIKTLNSTSSISFNGKIDPEENIQWDVSIQRAKKVIGYSPKYNIENSILSAANIQ